MTKKPVCVEYNEEKLDNSCSKFLSSFKREKQFKIETDHDQAVQRVLQVLAVRNSSKDEFFYSIKELQSSPSIEWGMISFILGTFQVKEFLKVALRQKQVYKIGFFKRRKLKTVLGKEAVKQAKEVISQIDFDQIIASLPSSTKPPVVKSSLA